MALEANHSLSQNDAALSHILSDVDRKRAFRRARRHSFFVRILRVLLPLCALAFMGLYFTTSGISLSFGDIEARVESVEIKDGEFKMVNPRLEGFTKAKGKYLVVADSAVQSVTHPERVKLIAIDAQITDPEKGWSRVLAEKGTFNTKKEFLQLKGDITVTSSNGMSGKLQVADIDMKAQTIVSKSPVLINMLNGNVRANEMHVQAKTKRIFFSKGVRVHILKRPDKEKAKEKNQAR